MNFSKITCIDLRKYNYSQLTMVSEKIGLVDGCLQDVKRDKIVKVFLDDDAKSVIAYVVSNPNDYALSYKSLVVTPAYAHITKRDKDKLLKMTASVFVTDKVKVNSKVINSPVVLDLDVILDKITKSGISSLLTEEKDFLDVLSKN
jgi:hypothetical protein